MGSFLNENYQYDGYLLWIISYIPVWTTLQRNDFLIIIANISIWIK